MKGKVTSLNISKEKGTVKLPVESVEINELGIVGDAHSGNWHRQVSLLDLDSVKNFSEKGGIEINPGDFAENILTTGVKLKALVVGDLIKMSDVVLEVTQIGKECHGNNCSIYQAVGSCIMPKEGIFTKVVERGKICIGDQVEIFKK